MEGWESLRQADNTELAQNKIAQDDLNIMFVRCFSTEAGAEVLEYLKSMTLNQPSWYPGEDPSHGFAREGQNSIVREIVRRVERGRNQ
tara:strand:+ start:352 stop:615 length:264 start_codon:yes stop_codon:yes gene_type:complete